MGITVNPGIFRPPGGLIAGQGLTQYTGLYNSGSLTPTKSYDFTSLSVGDLTFTRATNNAWYFDSTGTLQQANANIPRFDYDPATLALKGLLMEEARTNLFLNSQAPATQTITVSNATAYTVSFYGTGSIVLTGALATTMNGTSATALTSFTGTSGSTSLTCTCSGSLANVQVEAGTFATSRIVTAGASVARSQDNLSTTSIPWFNPTIGSMALTGIMEGINTTFTSRVYEFSDAAETNFIGNILTTAGKPFGSMSTGNGGQVLAALSPNARFKTGLVYKNAANLFAANGLFDTAGTFGAASIPGSIDRFCLFNRSLGGRASSGWMQSFKYWNYALSSTNLQTVTT